MEDAEHAHRRHKDRHNPVDHRHQRDDDSARPGGDRPPRPGKNSDRAESSKARECKRGPDNTVAVAFGAPHTQNYDQGEAETTRRTDLDSAEEHRLMAALQHAWYEQQLHHYHDKNVQQRDFNVGSSPPEAS
jgi:hypothetical protein